MAKRVKTGGRTEGTPNKVTATMREFFTKIIEDNQQKALDELGKLTGKDYIEAYLKLAEYAVPKLSRIEHTGDAENPIRQIFKIGGKEIEF